MARVKEPGELARQVEEHPQLPPANCERASGYGVMGLPFCSGHVLGLSALPMTAWRSRRRLRTPRAGTIAPFVPRSNSADGLAGRP
jgi:hypothetical protein